MKILLCAATEFEIRPVIDEIREKRMQNVSVLITGVGLAAATYALTRSVLQSRPDFILQAGIAGTLDLALPLTKIVLVESETIGDLGVEEGGSFRSLFDLNLLGTDTPPWTGGRLVNHLGLLKASGLTCVAGVTVNEISTRPERIAQYRRSGAAVESMEGAALHYVGLMEKIPFLQMRSLSNFAGERDKSKWMMGPSLASLNHALSRILNQLLSQ